MSAATLNTGLPRRKRSAPQAMNLAERLKELESNEEYHGAERIQARLAGLQGESIGDDDSEYILRPKTAGKANIQWGKERRWGRHG